MSQLAINSIYRATEGEGMFVGTPQVFVRLQGCSIGCLNCDSLDTWSFTDENSCSPEGIFNQIQQLAPRLRRVSITGGDPLHPKFENGLVELCRLLKMNGYFINIEASGSRVSDKLFDLVDYVSFDVKTPCTGVKTPIKNLDKMVEQYAGKFQVKSVIESKADFEFICNIAQTYLPLSFSWCLTPSYNLGEEFPMERFQNIIEWNELNGAYFRVIGQQHKWIHGPNKKQV